MLGQVEITVSRGIMEGKATPSGPPRTFSVMLGLVEVRWHSHGISFMQPTLVPSLGPIGPGTTAAEPPWGHGPPGGLLGEVPDHCYPHQTFGAQQISFPELCPVMPLKGPMDLLKHPLTNPGTPDMGCRVKDIPLTLS